MTALQLCVAALLFVEVIYAAALPSCSNTQMTNAARAAFLDMHNNLRSRVVRGLEKDALGGNAPKGSRMLKLFYDCDLEDIAQDWANSCDFDHSDYENGKNLWMTTRLNMDRTAAATFASTGWWSELAKYGVGQSNMLTEALWDRPYPSPIGHYTQMAWADTASIGCGIAHCATMTIAVCHYSPAGNIMDSLIYPLGEPCSECGDDSGCSKAVGLCLPLE